MFSKVFFFFFFASYVLTLSVIYILLPLLQEDVMARCTHNAPVMSSELPGSLEEALEALKLTLEDYQGQFTELQRLEEAITALETWIKVSKWG